MIKRALSWIFVLAMAVSLCACQNETEAYREKLQGVITEVEEMTESMDEAVADVQEALDSMDAEAYQAALEKLQGFSTHLKEKYLAIAEEAAPEEYKEEQVLLKQYAEELGTMLDANMEMYELVYEFVCEGEFSEDAMSRMSELEEEVEQYLDSAAGFDEVLNYVMGYSESYIQNEGG